MPIRFISDDDPRYFYKDYRIFRNNTNENVWGIKDPNGKVIIEPIFEEIEWYKRDKELSKTLIRFKLNGKASFCNFTQMLNLK